MDSKYKQKAEEIFNVNKIDLFDSDLQKIGEACNKEHFVTAFCKFANEMEKEINDFNQNRANDIYNSLIESVGNEINKY